MGEMERLWHASFEEQDIEAAQRLAVLAKRRLDIPLLRRLARLMLDLGEVVEFELDGQRRILNNIQFVPLLRGNPFLERRLIRPIEIDLAWDPTRARLFACDCAERVLGLFEVDFPGNVRAREAIETARAFTNGSASAGELSSAGAGMAAAARISAWAAWLAAKQCAETSAGEASREAPREAARARAAADGNEAGAAERAWQRDRLFGYLLEELPDKGALG